jgi:hypothetical protein
VGVGGEEQPAFELAMGVRSVPGTWLRERREDLGPASPQPLARRAAPPGSWKDFLLLTPVHAGGERRLEVSSWGKARCWGRVRVEVGRCAGSPQAPPCGLPLAPHRRGMCQSRGVGSPPPAPSPRKAESDPGPALDEDKEPGRSLDR